VQQHNRCYSTTAFLQANRFNHVWPIVFLRWFAAIFYQARTHQPLDICMFELMAANCPGFCHHDLWHDSIQQASFPKPLMPYFLFMLMLNPFSSCNPHLVTGAGHHESDAVPDGPRLPVLLTTQ
jgi:hypothetical protein